MTDERTAQIEGMEHALWIIKAHPDLPAPVVFAFSSGKVDFSWHLIQMDRDEQRTAARNIMRTIGGKWDKEPWDDRHDFKRTHGPLTIRIYCRRDAVCERRVVGTEEVTVPATPAQPEQPERVETREIVEWDCGAILPEPEAMAS